MDLLLRLRLPCMRGYSHRSCRFAKRARVLPEIAQRRFFTIFGSIAAGDSANEHGKMRVAAVPDCQLRPGSPLWAQIADRFAESFVEEWRRKYPGEEERQTFARSWRHVHASLPSKEAYWLIGYYSARECENFRVDDLLAGYGRGKACTEVCAITGLLVFRNSSPSTITVPSTSLPIHKGYIESPKNDVDFGELCRGSRRGEIEPGEDARLARLLRAHVRARESIQTEAESEDRPSRRQSTGSSSILPPVTRPLRSTYRDSILLHSNCVLPKYRAKGHGAPDMWSWEILLDYA